MISYDNYKNRIEKLAKAKRVLHKFRFLICGVLALIVGTSVGLMCAKGTYTSGMTLSAQTVMFNEPYEVTAAKAFLASPSEQHIEYRPENGDWTDKKPVKAGKYTARTVTKKLVGYSYSSTVDFEILPIEAEFTITGAGITYGDVPAFTVPQLILGHRVESSVLEFEYKEYGAPSTEVNVDKKTVKIVDGSGDDFTCCYKFVSYNGKTLNINKRNIIVTPAAYEFTYDAQPHIPDNAVSDGTLKGLVNGDTVSFTATVGNYGGTFANGAVVAGEYTVRAENVKIMHGGTDIGGWYNISSSPSTLTVKKRPITVHTGSAEKIYDGTSAVNTDFNCSNLVAGHKATVNAATLPNNPNVGTYRNEFDVTVLGSDGVTDLSRNYEVDRQNSQYGTLTINPCKLTVTTSTPEAHTYDGKPFTDFNFNVAETLSGNFNVTAVESLSQNTTDAGVYDNDFKVAVTLNGETVTGNFDIAYTYGKLTVNKRNITIITGNARKVYDGSPLVCDEPVENGKVPVHSLQIANVFSVTDVTGIGGVKNRIEYTVYDEYGKDVGYNYVTAHTYGTLVIEPLQISVKTVDASREYDGMLFSNPDYVATRLNAYGTGLCGNDELFPVFVTARADAGSQYNVCEYSLPTFDGVRSNYVIVGGITYGTLTVEPKKVKVTIGSVTAVYGESIPEYGFVLDCGALPNDETLTFTTHFEKGGAICAPGKWQGYTLLNKGIYAIVPDDDVTVNGGKLENYDLTVVNGTLAITQRVIYYATADDSKVYDGTALQNTGYKTYLLSDDTKAGLLNGDELIVLANPASIVEVQKRPNHNYYNSPDDNYYIDNSATVFGDLEVTPRPIIVYTASATKTYDAEPLENTGYTVKYAAEAGGNWIADETEAGLIAGDELALIGNAAYIIDAGQVLNANRYRNSNYVIRDYVYGALTVEKMKLGVKYKYGDFVLSRSYFSETIGYGVEIGGMFDGEAVVNSDGSRLNLPGGQNLTVRYKIIGVAGAPDVGNYTVTPYLFTVWKGTPSNGYQSVDEGATLKNYEITCADASLEVLPYKLRGTVLNRTVIYGEKLPENLCLVNNTFFGESVEFEFAYDRDVKDVGEYVISVTGIKVYDKDGKLMPNGDKNYDYGWIEPGRLAVVPRELTVRLKPLKSIHYGEELPENGYDVISGNIIEGDELRFDCVYYRNAAGSTVTPKNSGTYGIAATAAYVNGRQVALSSASENYNITVEDGILVISRVLIGVRINDINVYYGDEWTYPADNPTLAEGRLYYGETLEVAVKYVVDGAEQYEQPKNAGSYGIVIAPENSKIYNADGTLSETSNYVFASEYVSRETGYEVSYGGTLLINKKKVHIRLKDKTYEYGREDLLQGSTFSEYVRADGSSEPALAYGEELLVWVGYKKNGEMLFRPTSGYWRLPVGNDYTRYAVGYAVYSGDKTTKIDGGTAEELKNYEIICQEGALEITPYTVTVKPNRRTCVYGTPEDEIEDTGFEYTDGLTVTYGMPYGEELILSYSYEPSPLNGVGEYKVKAAAVGVVGGSLNNYSVSYEDGELTVIAKTIYVVIEDNNETTYGTAPEKISYKIYADVQGEVTDYALPDGYKFTAVLGYYSYGDSGKTEITVKNAGVYGITAVNPQIKTPAGEISDNYTVHVVDGKLTVNKKTVTVVLNEIAPVTYGAPFSYAEGADNYANSDTIGLEYGERLEVAVGYLIDGEVGTPKNANYNEHSDKYTLAYSARLDEKACKVYGADGITVIEGGTGNYVFDCDGLDDLKILRRTLYVYLLDYCEQYGDFAGYEDYIGNYKRVEYKDGEIRVEGVPYNEQFNVGRVEYLDKDGNVVESPKNVGEYSIRLTSFEMNVYDEDGILLTDGMNNYNFATAAPYRGKLEIVPRKITIQLSSYDMEYGEFYIGGEGGAFEYPTGVNNYDLINSDSLVYGQYLEIGFGYGIKYQKTESGAVVTPKDVGTYVITFDEDDYVIFDADGTYRDGSYDITFIPGTLTITQKRVEMAISSESACYGNPDLPAHGYVFALGCAQYGDVLTVEDYIYYLSDDAGKNSVTPRNAGLYGVTFGAVKINGAEALCNSADGNYCITVADGELEIKKAPLKLQLSAVKDAVYGDERGYPSGTDNFDKDNTVGIRYDDRLELAVKYEVYVENVDSGLVNVGDVFSEIPKNVAVYHIILDEENSVIHTAEGEEFNLNLNYAVDCEFVNFKIVRRAVIVRFTVPDYTYGTPFEKPVFAIEVRTHSNDLNVISATELPYGETCDFDFSYVDEYDNSCATPVNAGTYGIRIANSYVNGSEALAMNYIFGRTSENSTFEISKNKIEITLDDMLSQYGDFEFELPETHSFTFADGKLAYADELTVHISFTEVGKEDSAEFTKPKDRGYYSVVATGFTLDYSDGCGETAAGDELLNYEIVCNCGTLEITPKNLRLIISRNVKAEYGKPLPEVIPFTVTSEGKVVTSLPYGDDIEEITVTTYYKETDQPVNAGTYTIIYGGVAGNFQNNPNYFISGEDGLLTIEQKPLEVTVYGGTATYGYSELPEITHEVTDGELVGGEKLVPAYVFGLNGVECTPVNAGSYDISVDEAATAVEGGNALYSNYKVTYVYAGKLVIEASPLTVKLSGDRFVYGERALNVTYKITEGELFHGDGLELTYIYTNKESGEESSSAPTAAGVYAITATAKITGGNARVENYVISYDYGASTLTIDALPFTVELSDMSRVYGEELNADQLYSSPLVNNEKLFFGMLFKTKDGGGEPCAQGKPLNVGEYVITGDESNMFVSGGKLSNYKITFTDATLTVSERHIIVTTANAEREYNGEALTKPDGYATEWIRDGVKQGKEGLLGEDALEVLSCEKLTEIGSCENVCAYSVSGNYVIDGYVYGKLTVTAITITVTTAGITGEYRGTVYSDGGFTYSDKLLGGHEISVSGAPLEFLDATDGAENVFEVEITANGADVSGYYEITYVYGKVNISKRALTVTLNGAQNRFAYGDSSFDEAFKTVTAQGFVGVDRFTLVALAYNTPDGNAPVNAGNYTARLALVHSFIEYSGEGNGIDNYEITCAAVDFEIYRLQITLSLAGRAAEEYSGETHAYDVTGYEIIDGALLHGENIVSLAVRYCLDTEGKISAGTPKDAGTYYVLPDLAKTKIGGADGETAIKTNYEVTCEPSEFVITPRKLVITLSDVSHVYDGKEYDFASGDGFNSNVCDGDKIKCNVLYGGAQPVNAGAYGVTFDENIEFASGKSGNYILDTVNSKLTCTLTIEKREIFVTVADRDVEKGGAEYSVEHISSETAEGGAGFVSGDIEKAAVVFAYCDYGGNPVEGIPEAVGAYQVSVIFGGDVMNNYVVAGTVDGTLLVTERKVLVTPVFNGTVPYVYDGNAVDISMFGYIHAHNVENAAGDDKYGFTAADAESFTATFAFTGENGNKVEGAPVNAGRYTVSVTISGDGVEGYQITYKKLTFTIEKRPLSYTVEVEGAGSYVYSNSRPDFSAQLSEFDGFVNGLPDYTFELFDGEIPVERYNVGTYLVKIRFDGMENYEVNATGAEIKITRRVLVVTPADPYGGAAQIYNGKNLTLGSNDFTVASSVLENGALAVGDNLTVESTSVAPTSLSGKLTIEKVNITSGGEDVSQNYTVYSTYNAVNPTIKELGLRSADFQIRVSYAQTEIHYTLGDVGKTFPYTGAKVTYAFDGDSAVRLSAGETLGFGHTVTVSQDSVTVPAAAGEYSDLITNLVRAVDASGLKLAIYSLVCDNPENGVIKVTENVVSVDLSGLTVETVTYGVLDREVAFEEGSIECDYVVYAFNLDGNRIIGITLFSESASGRLTDLCANYKLDESCTLGWAEVKIITLAEAEEYARPAIGVEITVRESELESGRGTLYAFDGESRWVLNSGYTVNGDLLEGHELQVLVFRENGNYILGVTVYRSEDGARKDASGNYRLRDLVKTDVEARYVTTSEAVGLQRELYIDFSGAFNEDGTPKLDENGLLTGYTYEGLDAAESHVLEITATENEDGGYTLCAVIYQLRRQGSSYRKYNMAARYELPAGVTAVSGTLN